MKKLIMKIFNVYFLLPDEKRTWHIIGERMRAGEREWHEQGFPNSKILSPCWCTPMLKSEKLLLKKIHEHFYGNNWYIADPLGETQIAYIMYEDIKNRVF